VTGEARRPTPGGGTGERLAGVGLRLSEVPTPDQRLRTEDLREPLGAFDERGD
jgi:hypothetical protein